MRARRRAPKPSSPRQRERRGPSFVAFLAGKRPVQIVEDGAAALEPLVVVVVRRGDAADQGADAGRLLAAVLAVLEVDVVDDLADRRQCRVGQPGVADQYLEGAAVALVRELALEHVEAQFVRL